MPKPPEAGRALPPPERRDAPRGVSAPTPAPPPPGTILYIASLCLLWGGNAGAMKIGLQGVPPVSAAGFRFLLASACPCFFLVNLIAEPTPVYAIDARIVLAFVYQGCLVAGLTFVAWTALSRRHQVGRISAFIFLTPIFGVLLSWLLLGDPITRGLGVGVALVAAGIALVNRTG